MYTENQVKIAALAKALSHPVRVKIIEILAKRKTCVCGEIVDLLPLSQSTVSQHLKELKKAEIIKGEIDRPRTCYCLNNITLLKAKKMFAKLFSECCG